MMVFDEILYVSLLCGLIVVYLSLGKEKVKEWGVARTRR